MQHTTSSLNSGLLMDKNDIAVDRGLAEFRAGRPVVIADESEALTALPVEGLTTARLAAFRTLTAPACVRLAVTGRRAKAMGLAAAGPVALDFATENADELLSLAADANIAVSTKAVPACVAAVAAIDLAKLALGLPAVLVADRRPAASDLSLVEINADAVAGFRGNVIRTLKIASRADVPLHGRLNAEFVVFDDVLGSHPTAIVIGRPDLSRPVPVRLHSACLTGDVFGSRRCDCGDQLRLALANLETAGGGIVLYLPQEGRGLGLVNKMRAYALQDAGLDTVDANTTLGFDDDERHYDVAARMLEILGCQEIFLLTNNPAKIDGLRQHGITIRGRLPLVTPINADNRRYLTAKATRAGHHLDHVMTALVDSDG